jgi:hypothetical protein
MTPARILEKLRPRRAWFFPAGLFAVLLAAKLALIGHFGNSTPFWDQWDGQARALFIPALEGNLETAELFRAHGEHRIVFSRVLALGLLRLNGLWEPKLEMTAQAVLHCACLVLLVMLCSRHLTGCRTRLLFGLFALIAFAVPFGWENTLWGFQSQFYFVMLWALLGISCCWRHPTLSRGWPLSMAGGALAPAVTCGLPLIRIWQDRRDWRRQGAGLLVLGALTCAGLLLAVHIPGHDYLKADSIRKFSVTLLTLAAWPIKSAWLAPLFLAPLLLLLIRTLRLRLPATDPAWLLITLSLWSLSQSAAIAYGRAAGFDASRYADNLAFGLVISFACLLHLLFARPDRPPKPLLALGLLWTAVALGGLVEPAPVRLLARIHKKHALTLIQENHVRTFLADGDASKLEGHPHLHIPYPDAAKLAAVLRNPALRTVLPSDIREELAPVQINPAPAATFRPGGFAPATPARPHETRLGSHDPAAGPAATGADELRFPAGGRTSWLKLAVTGDTGATGLAITLLDDQGRSRRPSLPRDSATAWRTIVFRRPSGPFTLRVTDENPSAWFAFTLPREVGLAGLISDCLQRRTAWVTIFGLGLLLLALGAWTDCRRTRIASAPAG